MEVIILDSPQDVAVMGAQLVAEQIRKHPFSILGLATGSTLEEVYHLLCQEELDFSKITTFNLDEYVGLTAKDPGSYAFYMKKNLFSKVNLKKEHCHLLNGTAADIIAHCEAYEKAIATAGGIDLQLLGIGADGHIAFNEPGSSLSSRTRIKTLTPDTRRNNAPHFPQAGDVPMHVLTVGIGTIMESKCCLLMAYGNNKAAAIAQMVEGPISASWPATILQMHPKCILIIDEQAASLLERQEYYRFVFVNKQPL